LRKDLSANLVVVDRDYTRTKAIEEVQRFLTTKDHQKKEILEPLVEPSIELLEPVVGKRVFLVLWQHRVEDLLVEDDFLTIHVDPKDGEVIGLTNQWHNITKQSMTLSQEDAYKVVAEKLKKEGSEVPSKQFAFSGKRYACRLLEPSKPVDYKLTWYFRIPDERESSAGHFWDFYIDNAGEVLKLTHAR
jgi:predicted nuclease with TOPRIM domain